MEFPFKFVVNIELVFVQISREVPVVVSLIFLKITNIFFKPTFIGNRVVSVFFSFT